MPAEYAQQLDDIKAAIDSLQGSNTAGSNAVVDAITAIPQVEQVDNTATLDNIAQLVCYTDLLLLVLVVCMVIMAGIFVGYVVTERLR